MDLRIEGADRLEQVGRGLRVTGDKEIKKALYSAMNRTARPLREEAAAAALYVLPKRGGAAVSIGDVRNFTVSVRPTGNNVGVRIRSTKRHNMSRLNQGILRHPVYADASKPRSEWRWVNQKIQAGWFDTAMNRVAPSVRPEIVRALDEVAAQLNAKLRV